MKIRNSFFPPLNSRSFSILFGYSALQCFADNGKERYLLLYRSLKPIWGAGFNGVNRQSSNGQKFNGQPSKQQLL